MKNRLKYLKETLKLQWGKLKKMKMMLHFMQKDQLLA